MTAKELQDWQQSIIDLSRALETLDERLFLDSKAKALDYARQHLIEYPNRYNPTTKQTDIMTTEDISKEIGLMSEGMRGAWLQAKRQAKSKKKH